MIVVSVGTPRPPDGLDHRDAGEAVETGPVIPRVDEGDVDVVPEPDRVDRLRVVEGGNDDEAVDVRERVGAAAPDPQVVVDDRHTPGRLRVHAGDDRRAPRATQVDPSRARNQTPRGWRTRQHGRSAYGAVVRARSTLTLIEGLGSRIHQTVSPRGAARTRPWKLAAGAAAALDIAKARRLARDDRFALAPRVVLDAADLALWCGAARDDTDTSEDAVIPGSRARGRGGRAARAGRVRRPGGQRRRRRARAVEARAPPSPRTVLLAVHGRRGRVDAERLRPPARRATRA